jgi:hypothetical protein
VVTDRERLLLGAIDKYKEALSTIIEETTPVKSLENALVKVINLTAEGNGLVSGYNTLNSGDRLIEKPNFEPVISKDNIKR